MSKAYLQTAANESTSEHVEPLSAAEVEQVRTHLQAVLGHALFVNSKRLPAFLSYVVQQALEGIPEAHIKERTLGVEVFGRSAAYDTNNDPIVRITAGEVRKKLAQYYYARPDAEVQIQIPVGSYLPRFRFNSGHAQETATAQEPVPHETLAVAAAAATPVEEPVSVAPPAAVPARPRRGIQRWSWVLVGLVAATVVAGAAWQYTHRQSSVDLFWSGFSEPTRNVLIVSGSVSPNPQALSQYHFEAASMALEDAEVVSNLRSELILRHVNSSLMLSTTASLSDLRSQPFVLIGAFNNAWTQRLTQELPYSFERSADRRFGSIVERSNPQHRWTEDFSIPNAKLQQDYGIVARFNDPSTEQSAIIIAGISAEGTLAGGEALTTPRYLEMIENAAGKPPNGFEAVIKTEVIDGHSGPPQILAIKTW